MTNFQPSSSSNWFIKLIPTVTTVCVTLGAVAIYDSLSNNSLQLTNETGSSTSLNQTGATGAVGPQGPAGAKGDDGAKGDTGATGASGPKGDTGATGPAGPQGIAGPAGSSGSGGGSGGGSGMILKDANGVSVDNVIDVNAGSITVFKNDLFFTYRSLSYDGKFDGIPRPLNTGYAFFLTSDCTGPYVSTDSFIGTMAFTSYGYFDYLSNKLYTNGIKSNSPAQLYYFYENTCRPYHTFYYYTYTVLPASELPPTLASPIRITFN